VSRGLRHGWRLARVLLGSQYALMLEYRAEIILWALSGLLPLIMLGVWSGPGAAAGLGFSPAGLTRYFLAVFLVRQFTVVWLIHAFEEDVLEGRLSPFLLQPLQPLWRYVAAHLAEQATRLPFVAAILTVVVLLQPAALQPPAATDLMLGILAIEVAFALRFLIQALITMACFWSERAAALDRLLLIPYLFLSGLVAPLEAFPEGARQLALATPFPYLVAFPARLLTGSEPHAAAGFAVMAGWGLVLLPATAALWRAGIRRYSAMGA
jgi:ABC-2 type transport system permease protein